MPVVARQHQLAAILRRQGWTYRMLGRWSDADGRAVRAADGAWLEVVRPWDCDDANEKGVWSIVLTGDRSDAGRADVELAEQVAGLAPLPGDRAAWWPAFAFGLLSNQAKLRREALAGDWEVDDRFLQAGGSAIHLGSARVLGDPAREPTPGALGRAGELVGTRDRGLARVVALALDAVEAADDLSGVRGVVAHVEDGVDVE